MNLMPYRRKTFPALITALTVTFATSLYAQTNVTMDAKGNLNGGGFIEGGSYNAAIVGGAVKGNGNYGSVAMSAGDVTDTFNSTALSGGSVIRSAFSAAIGLGTVVDASGVGNFAVGQNAKVIGPIGAGQSNSLQFGSGTNTQSNTLQLGGDPTVLGNLAMDLVVSGQTTTQGINNNNQVISGVAKGVLNTDAVNLGQLNQAIASVNTGGGGSLVGAVKYDATGKKIALANPDGSSGAIAINNVAAGNLAANSTEAVNGTQLYETNQKVTATQVLATSAMDKATAVDTRTANISSNGNVTSIGKNSVQIISSPAIDAITTDGNTADGNLHLGGAAVTSGGAAIPGKQVNVQVDGKLIATKGIDAGSNVISNLAPGVAGTDAVNVNQLQGITKSAIGQAVSQANAYTDNRYNQLNKWAGQGISSAMSMATAAASAPLIPERLSVGLGYGNYGGYNDTALSLRYTTGTTNLMNFSVSGSANGGLAVGAGMVF